MHDLPHAYCRLVLFFFLIASSSKQGKIYMIANTHIFFFFLKGSISYKCSSVQCAGQWGHFWQKIYKKKRCYYNSHKPKWFCKRVFDSFALLWNNNLELQQNVSVDIWYAHTYFSQSHTNIHTNTLVFTHQCSLSLLLFSTLLSARREHSP